MNFEFSGKIWYWRGPSPFFFVTVPEKEAGEIKSISVLVTYGWGMIPVHVQIGRTEYRTSLWPKDGLYIVPIKSIVRKAEDLDEGDMVNIRLKIHL